jgi:hypothetical protein
MKDRGHEEVQCCEPWRRRARCRAAAREARGRRWPPLSGGGPRAEADEVGVVAVDEADELGDVGVRVEVGAEEGARPEPRRVRLDRLPEEVAVAAGATARPAMGSGRAGSELRPRAGGEI